MKNPQKNCSVCGKEFLSLAYNAKFCPQHRRKSNSWYQDATKSANDRMRHACATPNCVRAAFGDYRYCSHCFSTENKTNKYKFKTGTKGVVKSIKDLEKLA